MLFRTEKTMRRHSFSLLLVATLFASALFAADEWTRFRGPNGSGVAQAKGLPVELGPQKNVEWVVDVPFGRSSPALTRDRIFVTAVDAGKLVTLAYSRADGKQLWRAQLDPRDKAEMHKDTDSATPTPVTDGTNVYALFHEFGFVSYDADGKERWRLPLGPFRNFYGIAASPVLAGSTVLAVFDQAEGSFLIAVNGKDGKELWRAKRPARPEAFTTPVLVPAEGKPRAVVVYGSSWVDAYDVETGKELWTLPGVGSAPVSSPFVVGDTLYVSAPNQTEGGWPDFAGLLKEQDKDGDGKLSRADVAGMWVTEHFGWLDHDNSGEISAEDWKAVGATMINDNFGVYAIRLPKTADAKPEVVWNYRKNIPHLSSPLVYDNVFYMAHDGILTALDAKTGDVLKRDRLGEGASQIYASPVAADGKIYVGTFEGKVVVLAAGGQWTVQQMNDLGEQIWATPAVADGRLYVRTKSKLYSFAAGATPKTGATASVGTTGN
jgi:outer membrane protein assembly factor BamB